MKTVMLSIFHFATFDAVFSLITDNASENIRKKKQKKNRQNSDHRHLQKTEIRVADTLLIRNNKRIQKMEIFHKNGLVPQDILKM